MLVTKCQDGEGDRHADKGSKQAPQERPEEGSGAKSINPHRSHTISFEECRKISERVKSLGGDFLSL